MGKLTKLLSTSLLACCLISSTSVVAFASSENGGTKTNSTSTEQAVFPTSKKANPSRYSGKIKDMPKDLYDSLAKSQRLPNGANGDTSVTILSGFETYTYANAPEDAKKQYEDDCKSIGKKPNPSDQIIVRSNNITNNKAANLMSINPSDFAISWVVDCPNYILAKSSYGQYIAYIDSDYVGYNHTTQGSAVYVAQILLSQCGYNITIDGIFGPQTKNALENFQVNNNLSVDCIIGPNTWESLFDVATGWPY